MDPRGVNGGVFLGLDGVVIKSHGGTDAVGYARAIGVGHEMVSHDLLARIRDQRALSQDSQSAAAAAAALPGTAAVSAP
jgi:glycerol-3-phosphate acyltransferase PlsX